MTNHHNIPTDVTEALETLERATSPSELGAPYQVLLNWRRQRPARVFAINALPPILIVAALAAFWLFVSVVDIPNSEYWRGAQLGFTIAVFMVVVRDLILRRPPPLDSLPRRIEAAIDRWRHAVPAMREIPR